MRKLITSAGVGYSLSAWASRAKKTILQGAMKAGRRERLHSEAA